MQYLQIFYHVFSSIILAGASIELLLECLFHSEQFKKPHSERPRGFWMGFWFGMIYTAFLLGSCISLVIFSIISKEKGIQISLILLGWTLILKQVRLNYLHHCRFLLISQLLDFGTLGYNGLYQYLKPLLCSSIICIFGPLIFILQGLIRCQPQLDLLLKIGLVSSMLEFLVLSLLAFFFFRSKMDLWYKNFGMLTIFLFNVSGCASALFALLLGFTHEISWMLALWVSNLCHTAIAS